MQNLDPEVNTPVYKTNAKRQKFNAKIISNDGRNSTLNNVNLLNTQCNLTSIKCVYLRH